MKKLEINTQVLNNFFFFDIIYHSYEVIKKQIVKNKLNKNNPLIIKKKLSGTSIIELKILFSNSVFIIYHQSFFLFF